MPERPEIVCICGSMQFAGDMRAVSENLTLAGHIVLLPTEIDTPIPDEQEPHSARCIGAGSTWPIAWKS